MNTLKKYSPHLLALFTILFITGILEHLMGRIAYCSCGYIQFWYGDTNGPGNSQHITDWYSFSHFIHGLLFYGLTHVLSRFLGKKKGMEHKWSLGTRFIIAVILEALWEILENSPFIINRYRTATLAHDYEGDSILNSLLDIITCGIGFIFARKIPVWLTVALIITLEVFAAYFVRDNLTLNIIMLIYPLESIKLWQMGL